MSIATHEDVVRIFPGIQDHASLELLAAKATVNDLEAVQLLLQDVDEGLIEMKRQEGDRLNQLLGILIKSGMQPVEETSR